MAERDPLTVATNAVREEYHLMNEAGPDPEQVARAVLDAIGWRAALDQPLPSRDTLMPSCHDLLAFTLRRLVSRAGAARETALGFLLDLNESRMKFGYGKYGEFLHPFNRRDALKDALPELMDAAVYFEQEIHEAEQADVDSAQRVGMARAWRDHVVEIATAIVQSDPGRFGVRSAPTLESGG